jgi:hypothetical protein
MNKKTDKIIFRITYIDGKSSNDKSQYLVDDYTPSKIPGFLELHFDTESPRCVLLNLSLIEKIDIVDDRI